MAGEESTRAVLTALAANLGIGVSKFVAAAVTGSSAMLAEGVHSVADSANQVLLLIGGRRARRGATAEHPFGYARERYVYAFLVSVVLFTLGGLFAVYEGIQKITHPHELTSPLVAIVVLVISIGLEGYALRTAARLAVREKGRSSWLGFIRKAKAPELPTILLEDTGAVTGLSLAIIGVVLTLITGNGAFDGAATVCIGLLLVAVAVLLATETKSLLIGEAADPQDIGAITKALLAEPLFNRVIHLRTMHLGPEELLVTAKVAVDRDDEAGEISTAIDSAERRVRAGVPEARYIFIEPDLDRGSASVPASTSSSTSSDGARAASRRLDERGTDEE
jgi:cation diffusion facilitator family transporter